MADTSAPTKAAPAKAAATKKAPAKKAAAKKVASTHPQYAVMVVAAVTALKDRKGTSGQAIKKYIAANYKVEEKSVGANVRRALKKVVVSGALRQVKGVGAAGSFKVPEKEGKPKATVKKSVTEKSTDAKKSVVKKTKSPKKAAKVTPTKKSTVAKSPKKSIKKVAKSPAKKPKAKKTTRPAAKKTPTKK